MHRYLAVFFIFLMFSCSGPVTAPYSASGNPALDTAEKFFLSLKNRDLAKVWSLLTEKSRRTIVDDVYKATRKMGGEITKDDINRDFESAGIISENYWAAFLNTFDPEMILKESLWQIGFVKKNKAEILITHKKSQEPAFLSLSREDTVWKVGLVETFWARKSL